MQSIRNTYKSPIISDCREQMVNLPSVGEDEKPEKGSKGAKVHAEKVNKAP